MRLILTDADQHDDAVTRSLTMAHAPSLFWQLGPRIRVGGTLGKIGQNVKNAVTKGVTDVGHELGRAASNPLVQTLTAAALAATGVGAPAAAGIMAAERGGGALLKPHGTIGSGLKGAATGAVMGLGASKVGDLLYHGLGTIGSGSGALGGIANSAGGLPSSLKGIVSGGGSDGTGSFGALGDLAGKVGGSVGGTALTGQGSSLLDKLLLGGTVAAGAMDEMDRRNLRNKAQDYATGAYDAKAPIRARALALLQDESTPDFSNISTDPGNPYAVARRARAQSLVAPTQPAIPAGATQVGGHTIPRRTAASLLPAA